MSSASNITLTNETTIIPEVVTSTGGNVERIYSEYDPVNTRESQVNVSPWFTRLSRTIFTYLLLT